MPLRVACQMDPIERIDIRGDSTFALLLEAQKRGHALFYYTPPNLALHGDKRIILVNGKAVGAINRVPLLTETRSNLHVGGTAKPTELTARDREICERLGPELKRRGLIFAGIDVIGPYLTEINVTSPTGIRQVKEFGGADIAALIWDAIEEKAGEPSGRWV